MSKSPRLPEEALLGFDARETFVAPERDWDASRRATYLLRQQVRKPLSADRTVWPSIFGKGLMAAERMRLELDVFEQPDWKGPNNSLWEDLTRLRECMGRLAAEPHRLIAVSWVSVDGFRKSDDRWPPHALGTVPMPVESDWVFLGFDVTDAWMTSGLANCGYAANEVGELRAQWASDLNDAHLFTNLDRAIAFKDMTNIRIREHAPFFVLGLYSIPNAR